MSTIRELPVNPGPARWNGGRVRSGGVETVQVELTKFVDRPEEMLPAMDGSEGGEREVFVTGKLAEVMMWKRCPVAELDVMLLSI